MIKKLSLKFVLVFLVLVVSVVITSSCCAAVLDSTVTYYGQDYTKEAIINKYIELGGPNSENISNGTFVAFRPSAYVDRFYFVFSDIPISYFKLRDGMYYDAYSASDNKISSITVYGLYYQNNTKTWSLSENVINGSYLQSSLFTGGSASFFDNTEVTIKDTSNNIVYEAKVNTTFDYSFEGIKRGQVNLEINNLNSSLKMYGYVGIDTILSVGDTLDTTVNTSNLRLTASKTDNSDLNCSLYEGEELLYYIVDEDNVILDIGYISEMAEGDFLYGFEVNNGVDFVFLRDGQVYWDNNLTFKYSLYGVESENNNIVSAGSSTYIKTDKTESFNTYIGYVYDSNGVLITQASATSLNDLSRFSISVDVSYAEDKDLLDEGVWLLSYITLEGTNFDGSFIDFSNYSVRWSIPTDVEVKEIRINNTKYDKRNGFFYNPNSIGMFYCYLEIRDHISKFGPNEYKPFNITLEVYDGDGNLVLTHIINSDDIVEDTISKEENNVDKGDYDILDNPNYTGGSSNSSGSIGNVNNIQNWTTDDYLDLMSTDNFVWEFFKAILGNLPWWITTPLTILIFGVVIITLIRFARGA